MRGVCISCCCLAIGEFGALPLGFCSYLALRSALPHLFISKFLPPSLVSLASLALSSLFPSPRVLAPPFDSVPQLQPPQGVPLPPPGVADRSRLRGVGHLHPRHPRVAGGQERCRPTSVPHPSGNAATTSENNNRGRPVLAARPGGDLPLGLAPERRSVGRGRGGEKDPGLGGV